MKISYYHQEMVDISCIQNESILPKEIFEPKEKSLKRKNNEGNEVTTNGIKKLKCHIEMKKMKRVDWSVTETVL